MLTRWLVAVVALVAFLVTLAEGLRFYVAFSAFGRDSPQSRESAVVSGVGALVFIVAVIWVMLLQPLPPQSESETGQTARSSPPVGFIAAVLVLVGLCVLVAVRIVYVLEQ